MRQMRIVLALGLCVPLGCQGKKVDAPAGSVEAKLEGRWEAATEDGDAKTVDTLDLSYRQSGSSKPALTGTHTIKTTFSGDTKKVTDKIEKVPGADAASAPSIITLPNFTVTGTKAEGTKPNMFRSELKEIYRLRLDESNPDVLYLTVSSKLNDEAEKFTPGYTDRRMTRKK